MPDAVQMTRASFNRQLRLYKRLHNAMHVIAMSRAMAFLFVRLRQKLGIGQPVMRFEHFLWGANPSFAGGAPKIVRGDLQRSIGIQVTQYHQSGAPATRGRAGSFDKKAKWLEFGATIPDRRARGRAMVIPITGKQKYYRQLGSGRSELRNTLRGIVFRRYARGFKLHPRPWLVKTLIDESKSLVRVLAQTLGARYRTK